MSHVTCCVFGCDFLGAMQDTLGRLYCSTHWNSDTSKLPKKCFVAGCFNEGLVMQNGTGTHYCVEHAWESDRRAIECKGCSDKEHGLAHPQEAQWGAFDTIRAHGLGVTLGEDDGTKQSTPADSGEGEE